MEELEKKVEEAAKKYIKDYYSEQIMPKCVKDAFINGAKSPEAKEYWQKGMYSEEELLDLTDEFSWRHDKSVTFREWFNEHKKE